MSRVTAFLIMDRIERIQYGLQCGDILGLCTDGCTLDF